MLAIVYGVAFMTLRLFDGTWIYDNGECVYMDDWSYFEGRLN
jgi:hypothetical protein